ncbi:MAG: hypothetical protein U0T69_11465 [Chitinophagales bacterium]
MPLKIKKALGDVVLIETIKMQEKTGSGIHLDDNIMRLQLAKITMLDAENEKVKAAGIKVGDNVLIYKSAVISETILSETITYTVAGNIKFIVSNE